MSEKTFDEVRRDIKRLLAERPEEGWVFGVCATIARRSGWELWAVRTVAVVLLLVTMFWSALAYFVLAMLFNETRPDAQRKLVRWARRADDMLEVLLRGLKNIVSNRQRRNSDPARHAGAYDDTRRAA